MTSRPAGRPALSVARRAALAALLTLAVPAAASAHFPFLYVDRGGDTPTLRLVFGEDADAGDEKYLSILERGNRHPAPAGRYDRTGRTDGRRRGADGGRLRRPGPAPCTLSPCRTG